MKRNTILVQAGSRWDEWTGAITMPIYQTATFRHKGLGETTGYDYSRSGNPTRAALEDTIARLDGGARGLAFSSGLAAIDAILRLFKTGDRLLVTEDLYGGTFRIMEKILRPLGIEAEYVDTSSLACVQEKLNRSVKAIFIENPTNPLLKVADIAAISELAQAQGALTIVDNTFLTPCLCRPLELGADIVVYSGSKYLSGHNDVVAGFLVAKTAGLGNRLYFYQNAVGAVLGPHDSWLVLRGLKTLALRLARQEENARILADFLKRHPRVRRVFYPGLHDHPGHALLSEQASGFGGMISFEVDDEAHVPEILKKVRVFFFAESLGGVESLITFPAVQTHADIDPDIRQRLGINNRLLRLSVGIEDIDDLLEDLEQALGTHEV